MANLSSQPPAVANKRSAALCHWALAILLAVAFALELVSSFRPLMFVSPLDAAFLVLAVLSTLAALWRQLPLQNIVLAAIIIALLGGGFSALNARTDLPFGPFFYAPAIGALIFKTLPWAMLPLWIVVVLNSRGVARLILRPWRKTKSYGFRLIGVAACLVSLFVFTLEPFAVRVRGFWHWVPTNLPLTWQGASPMDFLAWGLIAVLMLFLATPVLIPKKPRQKTGPDFHPLCVWLGCLVLFGIGCAVNRAWAPVLVDIVTGIVVAVFAIRGAMW